MRHTGPMKYTTLSAPRIPLDQLRQAGADRLAAELHRVFPEPKQQPRVTGGFNSAI